MSEPAKPLHVQVAEVLGTVRAEHERDEASHGYSACTWCDVRASWSEPLPGVCAPRYDTDWSATGPLIERLRIKIEGQHLPYWRAELNETAHSGDSAAGPTPLRAVCGLILALNAAGKLPQEARA